MDPDSANQKYEAWQQYYSQGGQQQQQQPPPPEAGGYQGYFEQSGGSQQEPSSGDYTGKWQPPNSYSQPSYNSVAPPRADRSFRGNDRGGFRGGNDRGGRGGFRANDRDNNFRGGRGGFRGNDRGGFDRRGGDRDNNFRGGRNDSYRRDDRNDSYRRDDRRDDRRGGGSYNDRSAGSNYNADNGGNGSSTDASNKMIFVQGLPQHANETFIHDVFSGIGPIEVNESNGKPRIKIYSNHGVSKGECTIWFCNEATAQTAIQTMNGQTFPGTDNVMQISIAEFKSGGGNRSEGSTRDQGRDDRGHSDRYSERREDSGYDRRESGGGYRGRGGGSYGDRQDRDGGFRGGRGGGFRGDRDNFRGGRGGGFRGDRGDRDGGFRGGRGGFRGDRDNGSRGGSRGGGSGSAEVREGDWMCPCGNNNFSFRRECNSCKTPRGSDSAGGDSGQHQGGGQMRGPPRNTDRRNQPY